MTKTYVQLASVQRGINPSYPGCERPHSLHTDCLAGMLRLIPEWPAERPQCDAAFQATAASLQLVRHERGRSIPYLSCPTCRRTWNDSAAVLRVADAIEQWPVPPAQERPTEVRNASGDGRPPRRNLPPVYCGNERGGDEMNWSAYRRPSRGDDGRVRPGPWEGEWQCSARACGGRHVGQVSVGDLPRLW